MDPITEYLNCITANIENISQQDKQAIAGSYVFASIKMQLELLLAVVPSQDQYVVQLLTLIADNFQKIPTDKAQIFQKAVTKNNLAILTQIVSKLQESVPATEQAKFQTNLNSPEAKTIITKFSIN